MSHEEQLNYVKKLKYKFPSYFNGKKVLEIGSLNINGSIREFFDECNYVGLDIFSGDGVDIVCEGQKYNAPDNSYDVVCSTECFEHNPYWLETFKNMIRLCKDGGLIFFTCATDGRPEHGTYNTTPADSPFTIQKGWDYYKNLNETNFTNQIKFDLFFNNCEFEVEEKHHDLFFYGIVKKNNIDDLNFSIKNEHFSEQILKNIEIVYNEFDKKYGLWGWCSLGKAREIINCILELSEEQNELKCLEVGVFGGMSLIPFSLTLKYLSKGIVYGIDPWSNKDALVGYDHPSHQQFWGEVDLERMLNICSNAIDILDVKDHTVLLRTTSDDAPVIENISVLHIDGQHTIQVLKDIKKYASKVILNGYCFIDDVDWSEDTKKSIKLIESYGFELVKNVDTSLLFKRSRVENFSININQKSRVWTIDNFYSDPYFIRDFALQQDYHEGGIGRGFIGRRTYKQFLFPGLKEKFEEIMGRKITAWEEHTENGKFQIAWAGEPLVYHWDSQKWGAVLYLTPDAPFECGTTLFAHKKTKGRDYYEVSYDDAFSGVINETTTHLDRTPFEPVDVMGNVFNRLVIFDGSCIHSASEYFGCNKNSGRLWQMFFFDT